MNLHLTNLLTAAIFVTSVLASPVPPTEYNVHQFPNLTWVENIAVRSNGNLLVTLLSEPDLYELAPHPAASPKLIHHFGKSTGMTGITEYAPDVFAVIVGNYSTNFSAAGLAQLPGTIQVWRVDLRDKSGHPAVSKITDIPEAKFLNGMTPLNPELVLISDSRNGVVYRVNTKTGKYEVAIDDPLFKLAQPSLAPVAINGIHILDGFLYFENSDMHTFGKIPIDALGNRRGPTVKIADIFGDDFALTHGDIAYMTTDPGNTVLKITQSGQVSHVAGNLNSTEVAGATAVAFGRLRRDQSTIYVTTSGAQAGPVNGTYVEGGKVVAIDLKRLHE